MFTFSSRGAARRSSAASTAPRSPRASPHTTASLAEARTRSRCARSTPLGNPDPRRRRGVRRRHRRPRRAGRHSPANNALLIANTVSFNGTAEPGHDRRAARGHDVAGQRDRVGHRQLDDRASAPCPTATHTYAVRAIDAATNASTPPPGRSPSTPCCRTRRSPAGRADAAITDATPTFAPLRRGGRDVRVQHRRRRRTPRARPVHGADADAGPAHALGPRRRPRRQPRQHARDPRASPSTPSRPDTTITAGPNAA